MNIMEPINGGFPSENLICPQCSASIPSRARFCSSCGERIKKEENEEEEARATSGRDGAQEQEVEKTVRLPLLSRAQSKGLQLYRLLKGNGITGQIYKSDSLPQDVEVPRLEELPAPTIPVPAVDTKKSGDVAPPQHLKQQIARLRFPVLSNKNSAVTKSMSDTWGWLPALSLTSAVGVFLVALADNAGRTAIHWADALFWFGLSVLFVPIAVRMISPKPSRRERIALLVMLGSAFYLFRDLAHPLSFAYIDEFLHLRGAYDLATSGHLFQPNPLLPIGPFYPGLEIATNAVSSLTGLSIFASGIIVLGVGGLVLVLSFYLFCEHLSGSAQVAGIATLLYMANPSLFPDTQFAYESLAIPLAMFVLFAVAHRGYAPAGRRIGQSLAIWLGLAAVVITHHVTSYGLVAFLLLWTAAFLLLRMVAHFYQGRGQKALAGPGGVALLGVVLSVAWLAYTGERAVGYLYSPFYDVVHQFIQILSGQGASRQLFHDSSGFVEPLWERVTAFVSVGLISLGLPVGLFQIWRHHYANAAAIALAVGALVYPVSQAARLTTEGADVGSRAVAFLFPAVAFVLAIGVTQLWLSRVPSWRRAAMVTGAIAVIFIGGWILGTSPLWYRLPGPYLVEADQRSIEPEGMAAAEWAGSYLGPGHRMASDIINSHLMGSYGHQWIVSLRSDEIDVTPVFTAPQFGPAIEGILRDARVQYLVVDRRLSTQLPHTGFYFSRGEPNALQHTSPIDPADLTKFDGVQNVSRVFDSGGIVIYNVEAITHGQSTGPLCVPTASVSSSSPKIAGVYTGTILNVANNQSTGISLTGIQQKQGSICGSFTGLNKTGSFEGIVTADGHIQFDVTNQAGQSILFNGSIQPDGTLAGNFCRLEAGQCSDYGVWSLSPAT